MLNLTNLFRKFKPVQGKQDETGSVLSIKNWYEERYDTVIVQRNIMFLLLVIFLVLSIVAIIAIAIVINSKRFDPFVIQVDETTGMTKIVNPISSNMLEGNESLARYFIKKYLIARETYS